ncbi:MAG: hypothetical protein ACTHJH_15390 [Marmoricola sp.]
MSARTVGGSWTDAVGVGLVSAAVYALHGFQGPLDRDLGVFVYGGERVAHGTPPYVANFNTVGPLADVVPGIATAIGRLVGLGPVLAPRLLDWLISAACCALLSVLGRQLTGSRAGGVLAAALFLPFGSFLNLATDGPREKTAMVLFLIAAFIALGRRRFVAAGVLTALATLTWQPALLPLIAAAVAAAVLGSRRLGDLARFVGAGAVTAAVAAAAFAVAGALPRAVDAFLLANVLWVHQPSAFSRPGPTWHLLWHGYGPTLALVVVGPLVLLALALWRRTGPVVPLAVGGVVAAGWTAAVVNGAPDLFVVLPFGALGTAVLIEAVARGLAGRSRVVAAVLVTAVAAVAVGGAAAEAVHTRKHRLVTEARDVRAVLASAPAGAALAAIDAPQPLALSGRVNPTPFLILDSGEVGYLDHRSPGGLGGYLERLVHRDTPLLAVGRGPDRALITRLVAQDYRLAGVGPGWHWYVARSLGAAAARRVRAANVSVLGPAGTAHLTTPSSRRRHDTHR